MIRFIFVCMAVVALSFLTLAGQFVMDGIDQAQQQVAARNTQDVQAVDTAVMQEVFSPEELNNIDTAAGAFENPNDSFAGGFTNEAPKALADDQPQPSLDTVSPPDAASVN